MEIRYSILRETMEVNGKIIHATNLVRNELNKRRLRDEIVYTIPGRKAYYPRNFPIGRWKVTGIVEHSDPVADSYLYPYFISTDAYQEVDTYTVVKGLYGEKTGTELDSGYGIHHSDSSTTLGCIRIVEEKSLRWLVDIIRPLMDEGVYIVVEE